MVVEGNASRIKRVSRIGGIVYIVYPVTPGAAECRTAFGFAQRRGGFSYVAGVRW